MSILIYVLALGLFSAGSSPQTPQRTATLQLDNVSFKTVLRAHKVIKNGKRLGRATFKAIRMVSLVDETKAQIINERPEVLSIYGNAFKRVRAYPEAQITQWDVSDGRQAFRVSVGPSRKGAGIRKLTGQQLTVAQFNVDTFGLVRILAKLRDLAGDAVYLGSTKREMMFKLTTVAGNLVIYADGVSHLITKIVAGNRVIQYTGYSSIGRVKLPMFQRVWVNGKLDYEVYFEKITLNRKFPRGYFSRESLAKELSRCVRTD